MGYLYDIKLLNEIIEEIKQIIKKTVVKDFIQNSNVYIQINLENQDEIKRQKYYSVIWKINKENNNDNNEELKDENEFRIHEYFRKNISYKEGN